MRNLRYLPAIAATLLLASGANALQFSVTFPEERHSVKFSGRVVVFVSTMRREPRFGPDWFNPQPMYSMEFQEVAPGDVMLITSGAVGFPSSLASLPAGEYNVQAVVDLNLGGRAVGASPGNLYSRQQRMRLDGRSFETVHLVCDQVVPKPVFRSTEVVREVKLESELLSKFYDRLTDLKAAVILPDEWRIEPGRKFPVLYSIHGFGSEYTSLSGSTDNRQTRIGGEPFIVVELDANCPTGHSAFADSANNGPWGKALTEEFIPYIEKEFRGIGEAGARFVTGHSSGGWSSLWLQVTYPDLFGGVWSTAPDPVDFRDFQRINIYAPEANMFFAPDGTLRPLARFGDRVAVTFKQFSDMERPIRGEQLGSFEAVFSPRSRDGHPLQLYNRDSGRIDPDVARAWRKYDIGHILRQNWDALKPKLNGKLHVYGGTMDTFYLEGAVRLLAQDLNDMGAEARVELFPGDHGSFMSTALKLRIEGEMAAAYRKWRDDRDRKNAGRG